MKNNLLKKVLCITLLFAFMLTLASCTSEGGTNNPAPGSAPPMVFAFSNGNETIIINEKGQEVMRGKSLQVLTNLGEGGTVAQYFIVAMQYEVEGYDEYGYPNETTYTALYDSDGNLLIPYDECFYEPGYGDYLVRYPNDYYYYYYTENTGTHLVNPFTGDRIENIHSVSVYRDMVVLHEYSGIAYISDFEGNVLDTFPADMHFTRLSPYEGYYITESYESSSGNYNAILWDSQFNQLTRVYNYDISYSGGYFICIDAYNSGVEIFDPSTGETIIPNTNDNITYYNGEIFITYAYRDNIMRRVSDDSIIVRSSETFAYYLPENRIVDRFYYADGDVVYALDASGNELASIGLSGVADYGISVFSDDFVYIRTSNSAYGEYQDDSMVLTDENLCFIDTGPASYYYMYGFETPSGEKYIIAQKENSLSPGYYQSSLCDVLDENGNRILENLKWAYYLGGDCMYVESGFYVGIMRVDGTWVYKTSMFTGIEEESGEVYFYTQ
jgi:hypothetical protein